jgi:hypothetical protein
LGLVQDQTPTVRVAPPILDDREDSMALGFYFTPQSFTVEQYDETVRRLQAAGVGSPLGRPYHCAFSASADRARGGGLHVFDVWDSQESFDKFGETLMPIMAELGADPGEPQVAAIHNVIIG